MLYQIPIRGPRQMPPLATNIIDRQAVTLLRRWIEEMFDRVAPGNCSPGAPTDPYVLALEHTVPQNHDYYVPPW